MVIIGIDCGMPEGGNTDFDDVYTAFRDEIMDMRVVFIRWERWVCVGWGSDLKIPRELCNLICFCAR